MNTKRIMRAFGVALLMLVVLISTAGVAHADRRSKKDDRKHDDRKDRRYDRRKNKKKAKNLTRLWLNYDRNIYRNRLNNYCFVPGHYETQVQEVLVEEGHYEIVLTPAKKITYYDRKGRRRTITVEPARKEKVWVPARYETRRVQVWVPGYYTRTVTRRRWPRNSGLQFSFNF